MSMEATAGRRIGIFGGTFDPVHMGHLIMAEQCREQARLDEVWFVPAADPPHKKPQAPFGRRVEMLALAIAGNAAFRIDELEKDRPGPNYTVDTLEEFRQRYPTYSFFFALGSDSLPDLPHWRDPAGIVQRAALLVVARPGWQVPPLEQLRRTLGLLDEVALQVEMVEVPLIDTSSTDLRRRAAEGRSLRYLVPRAVECYILEHRLYERMKDEG